MGDLKYYSSTGELRVAQQAFALMQMAKTRRHLTVFEKYA